MSQQFVRILLDSGAVAEAALNEALQRQVVFGGSLDTNLLEVGAAGEDVLLAALGRSLDLPTADRAQIDETADHIPRLFPLVFAETYHLVPYRLVEQKLLVLVNSAPDVQLFDRIRERLRLQVQGVAATELRLHYAMHRLYGTALLPRFSSLIKRLDGDLPHSSAGDSEHVLSWGLSSAVIAPIAANAANKPRSLDVRGILSRLDAATHRDTIVEALLGAAVAVFDFAGLFAVHGDVVNGWRGESLEVTQRLARISLNVELPSVFQTIYATGGHYLGPLPQNSINLKLLSDMGRTSPRAALLAPILVGGKLAAILYGDNGPRGVSSRRVAALLLLSQRAGMAFERLIRRQKMQHEAALESEVDGPEPFELGPITLSPEGEAWVVREAAPAAQAAADEPANTAFTQASSEWSMSFSSSESPEAAPAPLPSPSELWGTARLGELDPVPEEAGAEEEIVLAVEEDADGGEQARSSADSGRYHAFADVTDNPKAALDDWQDVLIETAGLDKHAHASSSRAHSAPPTVTWDDVIAEAERASAAPVAEAPVEVAGTVIQARELIFDSLEAQDAETRRGAVEQLLALGTSVDEELSTRFPGRLGIDPLAATTGLPPFRACSGLLELIEARGVSAASVVLPHLESADPVRRLFAIYFLYTVLYPPALAALARRLYDAEPRNRYLAAEALRMYAKEPGYGAVVYSLRDQLKVPVLESQVSAVQVLGQLREPSAVPSLIPLVVAKRPELAGAAASALAVICGQAFGNDVARWAEWWQTHYNKVRPLWLIESLRHPSEALAQLAHNELVLLSGNQPAVEVSVATNREVLIQEWETWWSHAGRAFAVRRERTLQ